MAVYYVDPVAGSNANSGTEALPFLDFTPINAGLWNGNQVCMKRGTTLLVNAGTRANIDAAGGATLTAYGDAAAPLPILDGNGANYNPVWVKTGAGIVVEQVHVRRAPGSGIVVSASAGGTLSNITVQDCIVSENTQNASLWGTDGVQIGGFAAADAGTVSGVTVRRVVARDNGGHGIKVRGLASNVLVQKCTALRSGLRTPAHGMGTAGHMTQLQPISGANDIRTGWTNLGGNVWERAVGAPGSLTSVTSWYGVWVSGAGPTYYKLPYSATPSTPGAGECGIGAANTLRINLNGIIAPAALSDLIAVFARPEDVRFVECVAGWTVDGSTQIEGDGIYFDNGSYRCTSHDCFSFNNQGHGFFLNDPTDCSHIRPYAAGNLKGGAKIQRADGAVIYGGVFDCVSGTDGIRFVVGNRRASARGNKIIGATVGIYTNDPSTNTITEDFNQFVNVTTPRTVGITVGTSSTSRASVSARNNKPVGLAKNALTLAESAA